MDNTQTITLIIAVIGCVLGILNFIRDCLNERIKLKINTVFGYTVINGRVTETPLFGISVANLSKFPVIITEVGLNIKESANRFAITAPVFFRQRFMAKAYGTSRIFHCLL